MEAGIRKITPRNSPHDRRRTGNTPFEVSFMKQSIVEAQAPDKKSRRKEKPVSEVYPVIDNDLARDNVENDIPAADLEDL